MRSLMRSHSPPFPKEGSGVVCQRCTNLFTVPKGRRITGRGIAPANRRHKNKSRRDDGTDAKGLSSLRDFCVVGAMIRGVAPACNPSSLRDFATPCPPHSSMRSHPLLNPALTGRGRGGVCNISNVLCCHSFAATSLQPTLR